jgi:hypothetical protein
MTSNDDSRRRLLETARFLTPTQWEALSQRDKLTIETALAEQEFANQPFLTHRQFAEHPDYCRLTLSPMVAAIMDAAEGIPVTTIDDATCERYFGCKLDQLPKRPARAIAGHAGGRGGKSSRLLATKALHAAWTVPVPTVAAGESPVALIVSSDLIFARQLLAYCVGYATESPVLSQAVVGTPNVDSFTIRRSDGVEVELRVRAPGVKGKGGRAFTLVVALLDEAAFFYDDSGVINDREIVRAVRPRLVPGGQLWMLSTPWVEGVGVLEETIQKHWGTHEGTLAFRRVGTRALNPTWDPDGEIEAQEREDDPDNAAREIDAEPLTAGSTHWFSREAIEAAFRDDLPQQSPYNATHAYAAAADTGFIRNSSALAMVEGLPGEGKQLERYRLALLEERKPTAGTPLEPTAVTREFVAARGRVRDARDRRRLAREAEGHRGDDRQQRNRDHGAGQVRGICARASVAAPGPRRDPAQCATATATARCDGQADAGWRHADLIAKACRRIARRPRLGVRECVVAGVESETTDEGRNSRRSAPAVVGLADGVEARRIRHRPSEQDKYQRRVGSGITPQLITSVLRKRGSRVHGPVGRPARRGPTGRPASAQRAVQA